MKVLSWMREGERLAAWPVELLRTSFGHKENSLYVLSSSCALYSENEERAEVGRRRWF